MGWTLGGGAIVLSLLWQLLGQEIVGVLNGSLTWRPEIAGIGFTREYSLSEVKDLRVSPVTAVGNRRGPPLASPLNWQSGVVAFDYGGRTVRFGPSLDEAEAKQLVEQLAPYVPARAIQR